MFPIFTSFYQCFIQEFSQIAACFTSMVQSTEAYLERISDPDLPVHKGKDGNSQIQKSSNDTDQNN